MQSLLYSLITEAQGWSALEAAAVVFAVLYLVLAIRQNILCWVCAGISTAIYVYLFLHARLYMESLLNVFYFVMAVYGWWVWYHGRTDGHELPVSVWSVVVHAYAIAAIVAASLISGYLLSEYTNAAFPYIDSMTTWAAVWATFLVARKVLENWWYWLVIDTASIFIYWSRDLQLTSFLFAVYVIMIPFGLISWTRSWREARL
ncbi:MAG: nicotinamide riboside transporter PnuC [Gammaproteobacteria bacterium]|nr:nicotinamide riboside transporter PnuC [Gammaproteobacteria bacterium]MDH3429722.1 nicotinamide riboside transporter PnuC [Gammaproteobacteria bacterium]